LQKREKASEIKSKYKEEDRKRERTLRRAQDMARRVREQAEEQDDEKINLRHLMEKQLLTSKEKADGGAVDKVGNDGGDDDSDRMLLPWTHQELVQHLPDITDARIRILSKDKANMQQELDLAHYKQQSFLELIQRASLSAVEPVTYPAEENDESEQTVLS
jgi:hypothetical protein